MFGEDYFEFGNITTVDNSDGDVVGVEYNGVNIKFSEIKQP